MIGFLLKFIARWSYRYELTRQVVRNEIDADFLERSVADFKTIQDGERKQIETKQARIKELENEHKYELRKERDGLEAEVKQHEKRVGEIDGEIANVLKTAQGKRSSADATKMRIKRI